MPKIGAGNPAEPGEALVDADLNTLATALCVKTDDLLKESPQQAWATASCLVPGTGLPVRAAWSPTSSPVHDPP